MDKKHCFSLFYQMFLKYYILLIVVAVGVFYFNCELIACASDKRTYGDVGRLDIPSLNISVAVSSVKDNNQQDLVDADDTAAYLHWYTQDVIVDHRSQAFYELPEAVPEKTMAYLLNPGCSRAFLCVYTGTGLIRYGADHSATIVDDEGRSVLSTNKGGICMYTCNGQREGDELEVTLTYWKPVTLEKNYFLDMIFKTI